MSKAVIIKFSTKSITLGARRFKKVTVNTIYKKMQALRETFDVVRLVDVTSRDVIVISENGEITKEQYKCYQIWNKSHRCDNCISAKALATKSELTKFEFRDSQMYFVIAKYTLIDDAPYVLELGKFINDETLLDAYGNSEFVDKITSYNKKAYTDSLTGCYNRRYFDEQIVGLKIITALAVIDIDDFKTVNDNYGHLVGDRVLKSLATILNDNVHQLDSVIRMGGDEFVVIFHDIKKENLEPKLSDLRKTIENFLMPTNPKIQITTSIGGCSCKYYKDDVLEFADEMLYEAKKTKNTVVVKNFD